MKWLYENIHGDRVIWGITIFFSLISTLLIYVATDELAFAFKGGNNFYFVIKHIVILVLALLIVYYVHLIPPHFFSKLGVFLTLASVPLLLLTMFMGFNVNAADRWLKIPVLNLSFQTSDLAKIAVVLYLSRVLSKKQVIFDSFKDVLFQIFTPVILISALIVKSDFSTAALTFSICLVVMYFGGVKIKHILAVLGIGLGLFALVIWINPDLFPRLETWMSRLSSFSDGVTNQEGNYQINLSKASIIDGGIKGTLFNDGNYASPPQAASDFIFATLIKHFGLIGGVLVLVLYVVLFFRSIKIAVKADKMFYTLSVIGLSSAIVLQAFSNMAVAVGIFPVTGQPLPFISMGGTSIWFTAFAIGIILSVSKNTNSKFNEQSSS